MANKYPLVSNSATLTIEELPVGDTLLADNLLVTGEASVNGNLTVTGNINANLGDVVIENLTVEGLSNLGAVANIAITGGSNNYVLRTDGLGNLSWANIQSEIANPGGSNTFIQINDGGVFGASANFTFNKDTNVLTVQGTANIAGDAVISNNANINGTANINNLVTNISDLGSVANVHIAGGANGYVLATNGSGNLTWVPIDPAVSGDGGNASSSVLLLASLNGGNAFSA